jgi:hypothetical protein
MLRDLLAGLTELFTARALRARLLYRMLDAAHGAR